jgi:hypothetical protein
VFLLQKQFYQVGAQKTSALDVVSPSLNVPAAMMNWNVLTPVTSTFIASPQIILIKGIPGT